MMMLQELRFAVRSLTRAKGLYITVVLTLALGIGANAAIFSVVRGVLLRPLVNRDEDRLIYIRQSAPGIGAENTTFSVPELQDLRTRVKTIAAFGDFSTVNFTMIGLGEPRVIRAGVVGGSYFEVMGLRPVIGREHRMTELFGRLAPGAQLEAARAELKAVHADIVRENPATYSKQSNFTVNAVRLRDQITSRARTVLLVLLAASGLVFVVACSNVANLILARTTRREGELAIRAALGAGPRALRRTLLAESVLLCGIGAA